MPNYSDAGHRPHADHKGEPPTTEFDRGPYGLKVTLDTWGPKERVFQVIYAYLQANWGEHPVDIDRSGDWEKLRNTPTPTLDELVNGWAYLSDDQRAYVVKCFRGETLPQVLEGISFWFTFDGVTRPFTHQAVRTRQAAFMQHGGRDNDWRHRRFTMPETVARAIDYADHGFVTEDKMHCVTNSGPLYGLEVESNMTLEDKLKQCLEINKRVYAALVDAGIPWEDARRFLPMGFQTYLHGSYDWLTLKGTLANRLEHIMDWEYNCVAQLMHREIYIACPMLGDFLGSHSDFAKRAMFAGLQSWPPDGKWPSPYDICAGCDKSKEDHDAYQAKIQEAAENGMPSEFPHGWAPMDSLQRAHRPEQNPFWVLTTYALKGGPIEWIPTNGVYPHDKMKG
jgi:thymidylate synthase ThyX